MSFEDYFYNRKDLIGKVLFSISILFLISMVILSLNSVYIFIDERFSLYLIQLPLDKAIALCMADVHPPLYYIILKIPLIILSALHIPFNPIVVSRLTSVLPYLIILLVSATKLRKDYGWFIIGLFTFALAAMSSFYMQYLTIRMYNWGLLFLLMSFIYLKDVLYKNDIKSWCLFTLFTLLCGYTQYVILISSVILYLGLLIHYLINKDYKKIKYWFASAIAVVLLYIPWIFVFIGQIFKETSKGKSVVPLVGEFIDYFTKYALKTNSGDLGFIFIKIISLILLLYLLRWIVKKYLEKQDECNAYQLIGILTPISTIISFTAGFIIVSRILDVRYMVPVFSIIWLTISIFVGKLEKKRIFTILLLTILLLACVNVIDTASTAHRDFSKGYAEESILNDINDNDSIVVYTHMFSYVIYSNYLNNTESHVIKNISKLPYDYDVASTNLTEKDINSLAKEHPDKHVYMIGTLNQKEKKNYDVIFTRGKFCIVKIS